MCFPLLSVIKYLFVTFVISVYYSYSHKLTNK
uniref:Uncharacterized protein n=1 Tax=Siphoviridae sp. ctAUQ2 TaxID=2826182 RepID=A0A8S5MZ12_9CAUD|nr:MAG TPA: hypothetical protein [Siphoviridae sp. ctAUQ2]